MWSINVYFKQTTKWSCKHRNEPGVCTKRGKFTACLKKCQVLRKHPGRNLALRHHLRNKTVHIGPLMKAMGFEMSLTTAYNRFVTLFLVQYLKVFSAIVRPVNLNNNISQF
jgi:hypothetical protein